MLIQTRHGTRTEQQLDTDDALLAAYRDHFGIALSRVPHDPAATDDCGSLHPSSGVQQSAIATWGHGVAFPAEQLAGAVILVDSDVLIEHLRGSTAARDWLVHARQSSGPLAISVVSLTEIAGGMRSPERREVIRLLGSMQRFEVSEQVAWRAATLMRDYRRSHTGIGLGDYLIAATALTEGLELATLNISHYPMFDGLTRPFPT
jgi:predicted nucleic acid-binding protein